MEQANKLLRFLCVTQVQEISKALQKVGKNLKIDSMNKLKVGKINVSHVPHSVKRWLICLCEMFACAAGWYSGKLPRSGEEGDPTVHDMQQRKSWEVDGEP